MLLLSPSFLFLGFFDFFIIFLNCFNPTLTLDIANVMEFMLGGVGLVVVVVEEDVVVIVVVLCALGIEFTDPLSLKRERVRVFFYGVITDR